MPTDQLTQCQYKLVVSERFKTGIWYAISENDRALEPKAMAQYLNDVSAEGSELIAVVPSGKVPSTTTNCSSISQATADVIVNAP